MEEKSFEVNDRVVVFNPEAFAKIIRRKPAGGYSPKFGHYGTVLQINEEEGAMELAIKKPTKSERWWYLIVQIVTYVDDGNLFTERPLGIAPPLPNINHFGNGIPPRSISFKGTPNEIPLLTDEDAKYLDRVYPEF